MTLVIRPRWQCIFAHLRGANDESILLEFKDSKYTKISNGSCVRVGYI